MAARRQRNFRRRRDILADYSDEDLRKRYRFDRRGMNFITDLLRADLTPATRRNEAISAQLKVAITLRYLTTGTSYKIIM